MSQKNKKTDGLSIKNRSASLAVAPKVEPVTAATASIDLNSTNSNQKEFLVPPSRPAFNRSFSVESNFTTGSTISSSSSPEDIHIPETTASLQKLLEPKGVNANDEEDQLPDSQDSGICGDYLDHPSTSSTSSHSSVPKVAVFEPRKQESPPTSEEDEGASSLKALLDRKVAAESQICNFCLSRPKDACFIHGRISHQVSCYPCAKKLFKEHKRCPVCRRKIEKITKNILA